jgi:hypothetical protein
MALEVVQERIVARRMISLTLSFPGCGGQSAAFSRRSVIFIFASARAAFFSAAGHFVDCGPGAPTRFLRANAARFISFFDMFGLALLFVRVARFVSLRHNIDPRSIPLFLFDHTAGHAGARIPGRLRFEVICLFMHYDGPADN